MTLGDQRASVPFPPSVEVPERCASPPCPTAGPPFSPREPHGRTLVKGRRSHPSPRHGQVLPARQMDEENAVTDLPGTQHLITPQFASKAGRAFKSPMMGHPEKSQNPVRA